MRPSPRPSRLVRYAAPLALVLATTLAACGGDDETAPAPPAESSQPAEAPEGEQGGEQGGDLGAPVAITIEDGQVTPGGQRVEAEVGEPITLEITSDEAGSLHVHTAPEQEIAYDEGTTQATLTIDRPGIVEVESHDYGIVLQLEVR